MMEASDAFLEALKASSQIVTCRGEFRLRGGKVSDCDIISGEVKADKTATYRNSCSLELDPSTVELPGVEFDDSPLWPIGYEIQVWSGLQLPGGTVEEKPQGLFRISKPQINHTASELTLSVEGYDRSRVMNRNSFTSHYVVHAGNDYGTEIKRLIRNRLPFLNDDDFDFMSTEGYVTPRLVFSMGDPPWERALEMATSIGAELFFGPTGRPTLRAEPDVSYTPPSYTYLSGEEALLESITRSLDDEDAYNGVIIIGQNTENDLSVPRGEAWDDDPESPTYYNPASPLSSLYGPVPLIETSDFVTSAGQAQTAANARLRKLLGIMESVDFSGISNPLQEAGDVIRIVDEDSGIGANYVLDSLTKGLGPEGSMSGVTRRRKVVSTQ